MNEIGDLELNIMSCLLLNPKLMENIILEDKNFKRHQRLWQFMKAFYKKFGTFDTQLMYSICKDKWHIVKYMEWMLNLEPTTCNFELYQKQLINLQIEEEKNKEIILIIYQYANDLLVRNITINEFKEKVNKILGGIENEN